VDIEFKNSRLKTLINDEKKLKKEYSAKAAEKMKRIMEILISVNNMDDYFKIGVGKPEVLRHERNNQISIEYDGDKKRMIIEPSKDLDCYHDDGGLDLMKITSVKTVDLGGYHI